MWWRRPSESAGSRRPFGVLRFRFPGGHGPDLHPVQLHHIYQVFEVPQVRADATVRVDTQEPVSTPVPEHPQDFPELRALGAAHAEPDATARRSLYHRAMRESASATRYANVSFSIT